jgi:mRNA interferase MazF
LLAIIPISSRIEKKVNLDVFLPKTINNHLMKDSLIKTKQISSFDKKRFIKFVGNCEVPVLQSVKDMLRKYLSL